MQNRNSPVLVVNARSFMGNAIAGALENRGFARVLRWPERQSDLLDPSRIDEFFVRNRPERVFLAAGRSAGILGNIRFPAELMLENLLVACHIIDSARRHGVKKLLYLASNCCYPRLCPQPMNEDFLLSGPLEPTNEPYAVAKIAGLKLVQSYRKQYGLDYICGIPANTFGPGDDFSDENSHVVGALIRRIHEAKVSGQDSVVIWGTGNPRREFMCIDDLADACIFLADHYSGEAPVNLGPGGDLSIAELALMVKSAVGYEGGLVFDAAKPDGMPVKLLDTSRLRALGWKSTRDIRKAMEATYAWFLTHPAAQTHPA